MLRCGCLRRLCALLAIAGLTVCGEALRVDAAQTFDPSIKSFLAAGDVVAPFDGIGLDGKTLRIEFGGSQPTVLYVMAPDSPYCLYNENSFSALVAGAGPRFRWVMLSTRDQGLADYVGKVKPAWRNVPVTVVGGITQDLKQRMYLGGTPQTIVISPSGRVIHHFRGAYRGETAKAVARYFSVTLPNLK